MYKAALTKPFQLVNLKSFWLMIFQMTTQIKLLTNTKLYLISKLLKIKKLRVSKSSNNAIKVAKGKYVVRVDSDDFVTNEFINILSYYLKENPSYLGVSSDYYLVNDDGKNYQKFRQN